MLNCNDLAHILTQDPQIPTATNSTEKIIVNPTYHVWRKQDQKVISLLVSSLSENVIPCVVGKTTTKEAWDALNKHCSSSNPSRIMHLHNQLHNSSKGTRSVAEYVRISDEHEMTLQRLVTECKKATPYMRSDNMLIIHDNT